MKNATIQAVIIQTAIDHAETLRAEGVKDGNREVLTEAAKAYLAMVNAAPDHIADAGKVIEPVVDGMPGEILVHPTDKVLVSTNAYLTAGYVRYVRADMVPGWLPIESAPRDGRGVLVHSVKWIEPTMMHYLSREYFEKEYGDPEYMEDGWYISHGMVFDQPDENTYSPTHWMPLPPPPADLVKEGAE